MDRRQRKTREAIFKAFIDLLAEKEFDRITVGEIIARADVGRATFYAHFETKEFLLKALCEELFCHLFDAMNRENPEHRHLFACEAPDSAFVHLFQHVRNNDNNLLKLLSGRNNDLFLQYFRKHLRELIVSQLPLFAARKAECLPEDFWTDHVTAVFAETLRWWIDHGLRESPETITEYFFLAV